MATIACPIASAAERDDPNVVKVVADRSGRALYFSRAPIPAAGHGVEATRGVELTLRHIGLYIYRCHALQTLTATPPCELELLERLEQLRALWLGMDIRVALVEGFGGPDVDTPEDLDLLQSQITQTEGA